MVKRLDVVVICCFFLGVWPLHGKILPPQNVTLTYFEDFFTQWTWSPPPHPVENCEYYVTTTSGRSRTKSTSYRVHQVMDNGCFKLFVQTKCGNEESDEVPFQKCYPVLVTDLKCYVESSKRTNCNWLSATNTTDLRFYYRLINNNLQTSSHDPDPQLRECPSYSYTGARTGCDLQSNVIQIMEILFNGTLDDKPVGNTFSQSLSENVKPLALNWTIEKVKNNFYINWIPPDIIDLEKWKFFFNYTECGEVKNNTITGKTSHELQSVPHCDYRMSIRAEYEKAKSPWSEWKYFKADTDPSPMVFAAIIIPLVFAVLAVLAFVCCRQNKDKLFPVIPVPEDLLSGLSDNNNKSPFHDLIIPAEKEELCTVTLVTDLESDKTIS